MEHTATHVAGTNSSPEDNVYYDPVDDPTRPRYPRPPGEIGMVIDVYDAVAVNPKEFHSHHVLLTNITDRLLEELRTFPLEVVKGVFVENNLLTGAIFEKIHRGIILSVGLEDMDALENLWAAHGRGDICRILQELFITVERRSRLGVTSLELRLRLWEDEKEACRQEMVLRSTSKQPQPSPTMLAMVEKLKLYKKQIPGQILALRDDQARFEDSLSEMLRCLKGVLPSGQPIRTLDEYDQCCSKLKEKNISMTPFSRYRNIIDTTKTVLHGITTNVFYPISQIHVMFETKKQQQNKKSIRTLTQEALSRLEHDLELSSLRHPEWNTRLLAKEERFLGFVCLVPTCIDSVVDIDECLDEYMSGLSK